MPEPSGPLWRKADNILSARRLRSSSPRSLSSANPPMPHTALLRPHNTKRTGCNRTPLTARTTQSTWTHFATHYSITSGNRGRPPGETNNRPPKPPGHAKPNALYPATHFPHPFASVIRYASLSTVSSFSAIRTFSSTRSNRQRLGVLSSGSLNPASSPLRVPSQMRLPTDLQARTSAYKAQPCRIVRETLAR
jgi:hypothetical protein